MEDCETGFPEEIRRGTKEGGQKLWSDRSHKCHVEVVRVLCDDAHGKGEEPETWKRLHMGGVNRIRCQHLQGW